MVVIKMQKQGSERRRGDKPNKARKKRLASKNRENQGANKRTRRGNFVDPGNQVCFLNFVDGGKEKL